MKKFNKILETAVLSMVTISSSYALSVDAAAVDLPEFNKLNVIANDKTVNLELVRGSNKKITNGVYDKKMANGTFVGKDYVDSQKRRYSMNKRVNSDPKQIMYHIGISMEDLQGAKIALLPGDPGRVEAMAKALGENASFVGCHREYTSWLTNINGVKVLVCSTGMGGPSVGIGVEELARLGITHMIRFGTTGTIQEHVQLGDCIINKAAVRLDGTSTHFAPLEFPAVACFGLTNALVEAAKEAKVSHHIGISISSDTFWPGQERYDSFSGYVPRRFQGSLKEWQALGALNYEMETSALFVIAQCLGLHAGSVCGVIAKRTESESVAPKEVYDKAFASMIKIIQGAVARIDKAGKQNGSYNYSFDGFLWNWNRS